MRSFVDFLEARLEGGGFTTEDVLATILPLMRQVLETHATGQVAPLDGIDQLQVEGVAAWFEHGTSAPPTFNRRRVADLDRPRSRGVEVVSERRVDLDVGDGSMALDDLSIGDDGDEIARPVYLSGYRSWEHAIGHHDELTDVFSLGLILASFACGLDLRDSNHLRQFVGARDNLFELAPGLHPVLAKAILGMTELSRHRRPQDLRAVMRNLESYRDQEVDFALDLASIRGFGEKDLHGKSQIVLARLQERLFEISRRNRLLHFRDTAGTVCLTEASVPLSFDIDSIRPDQILTWGGRFADDISAGRRVSLNRYLNFREALYLAPTLDRIRTESLRDQAEFGFQQLRLVLCFLRWADVKANPPEPFLSPLVLLAVKMVKKKGVRDSYHLEPLTTVGEINPVLRFQLARLFDLRLPETIDLSEASLDDLYEGIRRAVESSDASVTVSRIERPRIDLIHERARRRLAMYRRRARVSGRGRRRFMDFDYSYDPANFHPLGVRLFNELVRPPETHLQTVLRDRPRPRHQLAASADAPVQVREKKLFSLRDGGDVSPYAWEFDLCRVTLGNFHYRKMTLVRDYEELLTEPRGNPAFEATFSLQPREVETTTAEAPPACERHDVVPCDPTQAAAIGLARSGRSYIIQGPPGTGKSQTITNLIADYVARGRRVLFVCEKRAAIDVVYARLAQRGLDQLCCLIHDSQADKRELVMNLKQTYESFVAAAVTGGSRDVERRRSLDRVIEELESPLSEYRRVMLSVPDEAGVTVQAALERATVLAGARPELAPLELERVPHYRLWLEGRVHLQALFAKLRRVQPDLVLSHHPLHLLTPDLHEADRPLEQVNEALDEAEPLLEEIVTAIEGLDLDSSLVGSLEAVGDSAALAAEVELLARNDLLRVIDPEGPDREAFAADLGGLRQAREAAHRAAQATVHWRRELPPSEVADALDQARRMEGRLMAVLTPGFWRLRRVLHQCYEFSAHAVRPSWVRVLEGLATAQQARVACEHAERELAERWHIGGDPGPVVAAAEALVGPTAGAADARLKSLLAAADPDAAVRILLELEPKVDRLGEALAGVLESIDELAPDALLDQIMAVRESLDDLPDFLTCLADLAAMPPSLAAALRRLELDPDQLEAACLERTLDGVARNQSCLRTLDNAERERLCRCLLTAHKRRLEVNAKVLGERIRARFLEHIRVSSLPAAQLDREQMEFKKRYNSGRRALEHEFGKTMRFKAIRDLVADDSGLVIDDLKPIWLMSPLSVSDTLPLEGDRFDVVIFDEASQITLEEAVPALFRAAQAIVVGDEMQLPPTNFFSAKHDDEDATVWLEEGDEVVEYDLSLNSFLSHAAKNLSSRMLGWHYRSRSESLISFSNWAFYQGRLLTVPEEELAPAARGEIVVDDPESGAAHADDLLARAVSFHHLPNGVYRMRSNPAEADYIAHLVRALLAEEGNPTIGVVAFSEAQQTTIEEAMERLANDDRDFRSRLEAEQVREEDGQFVGLLVKNLENIQGDERDVIILSVCYGPGPDGRMRMSFGPINQVGGERRLNVAFSRAKHHMAVVSSIEHHHITNDYNDGANCLKRYLRYAAACSAGDREEAGLVLREMCLWRDPEAWRDDLRPGVVAEQIGAALRSRGYLVDHGVGMSDFRCDLAVYREGDGVYRLGILVDEGGYYQLDDTLEREVLRPSLLAEFGWRVMRVLSSEWRAHREAVLERLVATIEGRSPEEQIVFDQEYAAVLDGELEDAAAPPPNVPDVPEPVSPARAASTATGGILDLAQNTPRYFEYIGGSSRKFWEITLSGDRFSVRFGRLGTAGQERMKTYSDSTRAEQAARRMVSEKIAKGYEEKPRPGTEPG